MTGGLRRLLLVVAVAANLVVLYAPSSPPGFGGIPLLDKGVHVLAFAAVAWTGRAAGVPAPLLLGGLVVHAGTSEILQATLLAHRSGDPWDVVADVVGIGLGWGTARAAAPGPGSMEP